MEAKVALEVNNLKLELRSDLLTTPLVLRKCLIINGGNKIL